MYTPTVCHELLNRITGHGLAVDYRFTRTVSIFSKQMVSVELLFVNNSDAPLNSIRIGHKVRGTTIICEIPDFQQSQ